jgi:uroporphyrinogen decarboxylase
MRKMNSLERINAVLDLKRPDYVPVAFHNFLQAAAVTGVDDLGAWLHDGDAMAEAHTVLWRKVGQDMIQLESGTCTMASALGCEVAFGKKLPPHVTVPVLKSYEQLADMEPPDPFRVEPLKSQMRATEILMTRLGREVYIQARADQGPMALAISIMDKQEFLMDCVDPDKERPVHALLDFCTRCIVRLCEAFKQVGAHGTCIGGMGTSLVSPQVWMQYEGVYQKRYVQACRRLGLHSFTHTCGKEAKLIPDLVATGCDCLELDPRSTAVEVAKAIRGKCAVLGMIDPVTVLGQGTPADVRAAARQMFAVFLPDTAFIAGAGCALPPDTPIENCQALVEAAKEFGRY